VVKTCTPLDIGQSYICHGIRVPCVIELVLQGSDTILYTMHTQNRPGIHHGCESIRGVEGSLLLVLCRYYQYFPYQFLYTVHICTPYLGGVRSEADVAKFCYTNKEQIFEGELQGY
jgi:hypothetical protein